MSTDTDTKDCADKLRQQLLYDGLYDWVSLAQADSDGWKLCPELSERQQQELVVDTLRTMVTDGLFVVGHRDTPDDSVAAFDESLDEVMARIRHTYIDRNDDRSHWVFRFWFELTDEGYEAATATEYGRELARGIEEDVRRLAQERQQE